MASLASIRTPSRPGRGLLDLPSEILSAIAQAARDSDDLIYEAIDMLPQIYDDDEEVAKQEAALREALIIPRLSLVCRTLWESVRPVLWQRLRFNTVDGDRCELAGRALPLDGFGHSQHLTFDFSDAYAPAIETIVRLVLYFLRVSALRISVSSNQLALADAILTAFANLSSLSHYFSVVDEIECAFWSYDSLGQCSVMLHDWLDEQRAHLRRLSIGAYYRRHSGQEADDDMPAFRVALDALVALPRLDNLYLGVHKYLELLPLTSALPFPSLTPLGLDTDDVMALTLYLLAAACRNTLQRLGLRCRNQSFDPKKAVLGPPLDLPHIVSVSIEFYSATAVPVLLRSLVATPVRDVHLTLTCPLSRVALFVAALYPGADGGDFQDMVDVLVDDRHFRSLERVRVHRGGGYAMKMLRPLGNHATEALKARMARAGEELAERRVELLLEGDWR